MKYQKNPKFNVISLFSGGGGSSCGYTQAGGKILLACEIDNNAVETYQVNYPETPIYHGDIKNLTYKKIHEITGIKKGELDILDGSPPCQGFSTCGKREYNDPKNQLYNQYIRILRELKPKTFIMENVQGLIQGEMKLIFKDILQQLKKSGYIVTAKIMHCEYYNNPTTRKRLIILGTRKDIGIKPIHPKPETKPITVKQALKNIQPIEILYPKNKFVKQTLPKVKPGEKLSKYHKKGSYFNYTKINPNKPCPTIIKISWNHIYINNRILMPNELQILQGFPETYKFKGTYDQQCQRIGNSVPPGLSKAISTQLYNTILKEYNKN